MATHREMRMAASAEGKKTYNSGEPCKHGHYADRYVINGGCVECINRFRAPHKISGELKPWQPSILQIPTGLDPVALDGINEYLHACMVSWCEQMNLLTPERKRAYDALLKSRQNARQLAALGAV